MKRLTGSTQRLSGGVRRVSGSMPTLSGTLARRRFGWKLAILGGAATLFACMIWYARWSDTHESDRPVADTAPPTLSSRPAAAPATAPVAPRPPASTRAPLPPAPAAAAPAVSPAADTLAAAAPAVAPAADASAVTAQARDAGAAPAAEARRAPAAAAKASHLALGSVDAGAAASNVVAGAAASNADAGAAASNKDDGKPQQNQVASADVPRRGGAARFRPDDEDGSRRVARFLAAGGADLEGRIVDVDTGRPVVGTSVEARYDGRAVEVETDANGAFKMPGMVPGSEVLVWVGGRRDRMVSERFDVTVPDNGKQADLGVIRLLDGDELASRLDGWIGVYVARRGGQVRVSAVNAWVPASVAGIQVGDIVLSVDGRDVRGLGARTVGFLMRGPIGGSVTLEIESEGKRRKVSLTRVLR